MVYQSIIAETAFDPTRLLNAMDRRRCLRDRRGHLQQAWLVSTIQIGSDDVPAIVCKCCWHPIIRPGSGCQRYLWSKADNDQRMSSLWIAEPPVRQCPRPNQLRANPDDVEWRLSHLYKIVAKEMMMMTMAW